MKKLIRLVAIFSLTTLTTSFGLDVGPRCGGSPERPQQSLSVSNWIIPAAHADLAPGPEDPCYQVKEGGACIAESGEPGTCVKSCYDQVNPETGKKMYQKCHQYCRGQSKEPAKSATPKDKTP